MDKEKLNDACDTAFLENYFPSATEFPDPRWDIFADGFKQGADWLMQQPLSERLTEEEKENIRAIYFRNVHSVADIQSNFTEKCLIDAIFGSDLFKNK